MSLIIPEGFAQVTIPIRHVSQSREAVVTFGVEWTALIDLVAEVDAIFGSWEQFIGPFIDEGCVQGPARAAIGTASGENLQIEGTDTFGSSGTASKVPSNVALLVKKATNRGGRRGRGRMYVPWIVDEAQCDDVGQLAGAYRTSLQAAFTNFLTDLAAAAPTGPNAPMYLLHSSGGSTTPGAPNEVTSLTVDSLVATQRRRLRS